MGSKDLTDGSVSCRGKKKGMAERLKGILGLRKHEATTLDDTRFESSVSAERPRPWKSVSAVRETFTLDDFQDLMVDHAENDEAPDMGGYAADVNDGIIDGGSEPRRTWSFDDVPKKQTEAVTYETPSTYSEDFEMTMYDFLPPMEEAVRRPAGDRRADVRRTFDMPKATLDFDELMPIDGPMRMHTDATSADGIRMEVHADVTADVPASMDIATEAAETETETGSIPISMDMCDAMRISFIPESMLLSEMDDEAFMECPPESAHADITPEPAESGMSMDMCDAMRISFIPESMLLAELDLADLTGYFNIRMFVSSDDLIAAVERLPPIGMEGLDSEEAFYAISSHMSADELSAARDIIGTDHGILSTVTEAVSAAMAVHAMTEDVVIGSNVTDMPTEDAAWNMGYVPNFILVTDGTEPETPVDVHADALDEIMTYEMLAAFDAEDAIHEVQTSEACDDAAAVLEEAASTTDTEPKVTVGMDDVDGVNEIAEATVEVIDAYAETTESLDDMLPFEALETFDVDDAAEIYGVADVEMDIAVVDTNVAAASNVSFDFFTPSAEPASQVCISFGIDPSGERKPAQRMEENVIYL